MILIAEVIQFYTFEDILIFQQSKLIQKNREKNTLKNKLFIIAPIEISKVVSVGRFLTSLLAIDEFSRRNVAFPIFIF